MIELTVECDGSYSACTLYQDDTVEDCLEWYDFYEAETCGLEWGEPVDCTEQYGLFACEVTQGVDTCDESELCRVDFQEDESSELNSLNCGEFEILMTGDEEAMEEDEEVEEELVTDEEAEVEETEDDEAALDEEDLDEETDSEEQPEDIDEQDELEAPEDIEEEVVCVIEHGPFACNHEYDLVQCAYMLNEDTCTDLWSCEVSYQSSGELVTMDCDELDQEWWNQGEDCDTTCTYPVDCENSYFEWCKKTECHDTCEQELMCYAEWINQYGELRTSTCEYFDDVNWCSITGEDIYEIEDCSYESCDDTNTCWIEHCDEESRCREETCTQWIVIDDEWKVYDCTEHVDYSQYEYYFDNHILPLAGELQDEVEMVLDTYDYVQDSVEAGVKLLCHESEDCFVSLADAVGLHNIIPDIEADRNVELIDAFLEADQLKDVANAMVRDSQVIIDEMEAPFDLDWMHTALSAQDTYELETMWQDMLFGAFWGNEVDAEEEEEIEEEIAEEVTEEVEATEEEDDEGPADDEVPVEDDLTADDEETTTEDDDGEGPADDEVPVEDDLTADDDETTTEEAERRNL